jgi:predicted CoA-binding protein
VVRRIAPDYKERRKQGRCAPMTADGLDDDAIRNVLTTVRRIALVGASKKPARAANEIQAFLQRQGYDVTPINPGIAGETLHGRTVVPSLADAAPVEMVDIFRETASVPPIVDDAVRLGARVIWMQLGIVHEAAAQRARDAGLIVVMDRCPLIEMRRLRIMSIGSSAT